MTQDARLRVPVLYDFASSICYVGHRVMERMANDLAELEIELIWSPIDLARITHWRRGAPIEGPGRVNALRVASDLGVEVRMPVVWMDSRPFHAIALALHGTESELSWREAVFSSVFELGRSLDEPDLLESLGRDLGIGVRELCTEPQLDALDDATERARLAEVTGVPTFMLDEWPFGGIQQPATMRSLLGRWAAKKRS